MENNIVIAVKTQTAKSSEKLSEDFGNVINHKKYDQKLFNALKKFPTIQFFEVPTHVHNLKFVYSSANQTVQLEGQSLQVVGGYWNSSSDIAITNGILPGKIIATVNKFEIIKSKENIPTENELEQMESISEPTDGYKIIVTRIDKSIPYSEPGVKSLIDQAKTKIIQSDQSPIGSITKDGTNSLDIKIGDWFIVAKYHRFQVTSVTDDGVNSPSDLDLDGNYHEYDGLNSYNDQTMFRFSEISMDYSNQKK